MHTVNTLCEAYYKEAYTQASEIQKKVLVSRMCSQLQKDFNISQPAVSFWKLKGIPAERMIEIVRLYKLPPEILMR